MSWPGLECDPHLQLLWDLKPGHLPQADHVLAFLLQSGRVFKVTFICITVGFRKLFVHDRMFASEGIFSFPSVVNTELFPVGLSRPLQSLLSIHHTVRMLFIIVIIIKLNPCLRTFFNGLGGDRGLLRVLTYSLCCCCPELISSSQVDLT